MTSPSEFRPSSGAGNVFILLVALALMALVAAVFVRSLALSGDAAKSRTEDAGRAPADEKIPEPAAATDDPAPSELWTVETDHQQPSPEPAAKSARLPALTQVSTQAAPSNENGTNQARTNAEATRPDRSRGILVEELSKETYNALAELHAVLQSEAWDDAAKLIAAGGPASGHALAPYFGDHELLVSLPVAVQMAREDYQPLRTALDENMAALAKLRVTQAMNAGQSEVVEFAAVQFAGSPAAADAHRWLGDRALMLGQFAKAIAEYERAGNRSAPENDAVLPRIRLAAAMMGRDLGTPATQAVRFGDVTMTPAAFERLVAEMRERGQLVPTDFATDSQLTVPTASDFESHVRGRLDGAVGERPEDDLGRGINKLRVPWVDRQIATAVAGEVLFVSNRFQVAAYQLPGGKRIWQSQPPPGPMQRAQEWGLIPMRPLVVGDRVYARLLYSPSPLLVCLDRASGKQIWVGESRDNEFLVSDPLVVDGQLVALGVLIQPDQQGAVRYHQFDLHTGDIVRTYDLVKLRSTWGARACCQITELDDGIAVALGGAVLAIDDSANIRWIRTHAAASPDEDRRWREQIFQRPMVKQGRLYVAQPGVRAVDCLSAATGRAYWSVALPDVVGVIGFGGDVLVVQTAAGVCGIDLMSGKRQWQHAAENLFSFHLVDDSKLLLASRERVPGRSDRWQPRLTWLNPGDGKPMATTVLSNLADSDPRLGPLVPYRKSLFTFYGRGQTDPTRDLVELVPKGQAEFPGAR